MPLSSPLPFEEIRASAALDGLNLVGMVSAQEFDRCQPRGRRLGELLPGCGTAVVMASGGRGFASRARRNGGARAGTLPWSARMHWADHGRRVVTDLALRLQNCGERCRAVLAEEGSPLNFLQLGETAGLGTVSPVIDLLIHPEYGPWLRVHGAVLLQGTPLGRSWTRPVVRSFQPCATCARPCLTACPVGVYDGRGGKDARACATHRHTGHCRDRCDVRRACPVGAEHRWDTAEETHHQLRSLDALRRQHGLGRWRWVPSVLRRPV